MTETIQWMGLTEEEAERRRAEGQGHYLHPPTNLTYGKILRRNLFSFFNVVLFSIGLAIAILGSPKEAFVTVGTAVLNVIISTIQEVRAKRKLDQIALLTRPTAHVLREGHERDIAPDEIVLDDLMIVRPGDQILVDGEVVGSGSIDVDESLQTGESDPVTRATGSPLLSGSFVVNGQTVYRATKVGADSWASQLTTRARTFKEHTTPLQQNVNLVIRVLLIVVLFFGAIIIVRNLVSADLTLLESMRRASVVFGLAPGSLFLMIVLAYALGAVRIANQGALVQQVNAVESLCHVTVLCIDKTGTLTTNQLRLEQVISLANELFPEEKLRRILGTYTHSITATNPTSQAIAQTCAGSPQVVLEEIPFSSSRKYSALSFEPADRTDGLRGVYVLGAPELLLPHLYSPQRLLEQAFQWTDQGLRVLFLAYLPEIQPLHTSEGEVTLPDGLIPLAWVVLSDILRPEAVQTLANFRQAGITLKIISGDSPETVAALARQAGLGEEGRPLKIVSGAEIDQMDDATLAGVVQETTIFGRITPEQKDRLVGILRGLGHYVAMTGDGVNDVLALKQAHVGIAMQSGSQAARSVANIILLNDSFAALPKAFLEGQRILNGQRDVLKLYLTSILSLAVFIIAIGLVGEGFPYTPGQNAIISALTLAIPAFFLAWWARPGPGARADLTRRMIHFVAPAMILNIIFGVGVYLYFMLTTHDYVIAQLGLTYLTALTGFILLIFVEPPKQFWVGGDELADDPRPSILAVVLLIFFLIGVNIPVLRSFFGLDLLPNLRDYFVIFGAVIAWIFSLRYAWRKRLLDHYLDVDLEGPALPATAKPRQT